jgi:cell wall-associated NlpC family hydrolase
MSRPAKAILAALVAATLVGSLAAPARAEGERYEVKPGDYLKGIAAKMGVALPVLLSANELKITSVIHPGDTLVVPAGGSLPIAPTAPAVAAPAAPVAPVAPATTPYVVQNGEYFFSIAAKHGVTVGALLAANAMKITTTIMPGQTLAIPPRTLPIAPPPAPPSAAPAPAAAAAAAPAPAAASPIETVLAYLQQQVGKPYKFNTAGPETFDCSGLVRAGFLQVGIRLPHYSVLQSKLGTAVDWSVEPILPGDLVFTFSSSSPGEIGHVGIALDSKRWIQAAGNGDAVKISSLPKVIRAVRRIL